MKRNDDDCRCGGDDTLAGVIVAIIALTGAWLLWALVL